MKQNPTSLSLALSVLLTPLAMATDGTWSATSGGNWGDAPNWAPGSVADGSGATASFTSDIGAATTVTLDGPRTVGQLVFSDNGAAGSPWILSHASNILTLAGGVTPTITATSNATISSKLGGTQGLTKLGDGTLTLGAVNTYTGATAVSGGTLVVAPTVNAGNNGTHTQASSGYSVASGATLRFDGSTVQGGTAFVIWDINPVSISSGGTLELATDATIHSNVGTNAVLLYWGASDQISGSGSINKEGDGVIDVNGNGTLNLFTGTINVNAGQLALQGGNTSNNGTYTVDIDSGASLDIRTDSHRIGALNGTGAVVSSNGGNSALILGNSGTNGNFGGNMSGPFALTKTGAGTQILGGTNSYSKATTINGGQLVIDGTSTNSAFAVNTGGTLGGAGSIGGTVTVNTGGIIAPGSGTGSSIAMLTIGNNLTLNAGSKTLCEVKKAGLVLSNDQLYVNGVTYGGTLEVTASGDALVAGNEFKLFDAVNYGGSFGTITLPTLSGGLVWDLTGLAGSGTIKVSSQAEAPVFSPIEGTYVAPQTITMTSGSGTTVYYTFVSGGAEPPNPTTGSSSGTPGSGVATVNLPTTGTWKVKAFATKAGLGNSAVALGTFTLIPTPVWTNTAGGFWSDLPEDATNWLNGLVADGSNIPADFSTLTLTADTTVTLDSDRTIGGLLFGDVGNQFDWTLDGFAALTLDGATPTIAVNNQTAHVAVPLAGSAGLTKTGAGELSLSAANAYTGATTVNNGTLIFSPLSATALSTSGFSVDNTSTLRFDASNVGTGFPNWNVKAATIASGAKVEFFDSAHTGGPNTNGVVITTGSSFTGSGSINKEGAGNIIINSAGALSNFTGTVNVNGGVLTLQGGSTTTSGAFAVNVGTGGTFDIRTDVQTIGALNGSGVLTKSFGGFNGDFTIGNGGANGSFSGNIAAGSGSLNMIKVGAGTQVFSGTHSNVGTITVNGGTLDVTGSLRLKPTTNGSVNTIGGSATLALNGTLSLDLSTANTTAGNSWLLVDTANLSESYGNGFGLTTTAAENFTETSDGSGVWTLTAGSNKWTFTESSGILNVTAAAGYQAWIDSFFSGVTDPAVIGATADPDHDGMANIVEFVLDGNPSSGTAINTPAITTSGSNLVFTFTRRDDAEYLNPSVEFDADLQGPWTTAIDGGNSAFVVQENGAAPDTVTVTIPKGANPRLFARLVVTP